MSRSEKSHSRKNLASVPQSEMLRGCHHLERVHGIVLNFFLTEGHPFTRKVSWRSSEFNTRNLTMYYVNLNEDVLKQNNSLCKTKRMNNFILQSILNTVTVMHETSPRPFSIIKEDVSSQREKSFYLSLNSTRAWIRLRRIEAF